MTGDEVKAALQNSGGGAAIEVEETADAFIVRKTTEEMCALLLAGSVKIYGSYEREGITFFVIQEVTGYETHSGNTTITLAPNLSLSFGTSMLYDSENQYFFTP